MTQICISALFKACEMRSRTRLNNLPDLCGFGRLRKRAMSELENPAQNRHVQNPRKVGRPKKTAQSPRVEKSRKVGHQKDKSRATLECYLAFSLYMSSRYIKESAIEEALGKYHNEEF
jgi:hypothetical protein